MVESKKFNKAVSSENAVSSEPLYGSVQAKGIKGVKPKSPPPTA